jgi:hypothetical protein
MLPIRLLPGTVGKALKAQTFVKQRQRETVNTLKQFL